LPVVTPPQATDVQPQLSGNADSGDTDEPPDDDPTVTDEAPIAFALAPKQILANETFSESVSAAPTVIDGVRPSEIISKLVESAELVRAADSDTITLHLKPENLGKVEVQLTLSAEGSLTVKMTADHDGVRGLLNSQLSQLVSSLSEKGLKVTGAEVVYSGVGNDEYNRGGNKNPQERGTNQTRRQVHVTRSVEVTDAYAPYYGESDETAIEFVA
jgi:flagellar hook-length control protein FliK